MLVLYLSMAKRKYLFALLTFIMEYHSGYRNEFHNDYHNGINTVEMGREEGEEDCSVKFSDF